MAKRRRKHRRNPSPYDLGAGTSWLSGEATSTATASQLGPLGQLIEGGNKLMQKLLGPPETKPAAAPAKLTAAQKLRLARKGGQVGWSIVPRAKDPNAGLKVLAKIQKAKQALAKAEKELAALQRNAAPIRQITAKIAQIERNQVAIAKAEGLLGDASTPLAAVEAALGVAAVKRGGRRAKRAGRKGRGAYLSVNKAGRISKASLKRLQRIGKSRVSYVGKGKNRKMVIKMNPSVGGIVGLVSAAAGMGAGYVLATNVVPKLVGRVVPQAASGLVGLAVGGVGGYAVSRLVARYNPSVASQLYVGALAAVGAGIVAAVVKLLPANVKAPLGLGRMNDYLQLSGRRGMADYMQLSGPVPEQLFAGGLNDYVDFTSRSAGKAAEAISAQITEWTPTGNEGF